jgi:probable F420-dependent oxidoreductase
VSRLAPVGVWLNVLGTTPAREAVAAAREIERLGYGALWVGEAPGSKEAFTHAGLLLAGTARLMVATGIAAIGARDATATKAASLTLGEAYPGRFLLGLGVSHGELGRGYGHDTPLSMMRRYLEALAAEPYPGPLPGEPVPRVVAALRPRMQELARNRADGVHSFCVPPTHTAAARARLGPDKLLVPEQAVVVDADPARARETARAHVATRLVLRHYIAHLEALGFDADDFADSGSDRLVDTLVAQGDAATVAARVREHLDAGADQVAVHPLGPLDATLIQLGVLAAELPVRTVPHETRDEATA